MELKHLEVVEFNPHFGVTFFACPFCGERLSTKPFKLPTYHHEGCKNGDAYFFNGYALGGVGEYNHTEKDVPRETVLPDSLAFDSKVCKF